jgi:hypothetical protein
MVGVIFQNFQRRELKMWSNKDPNNLKRRFLIWSNKGLKIETTSSQIKILIILYLKGIWGVCVGGWELAFKNLDTYFYTTYQST